LILQSDDESSSEESNMITEEAFKLDEVNQLDKLCSDAGATSVMTPNINRVSDFKSKIEYVKMPNNKLLTSIGRGRMGCINNVMVVPKLRDTLVSVSVFDKLGFYTVYGNNKVRIYDKDPLKNSNTKIIAEGTMKNNLYYFDANEDFEFKEESANNLLRTRSGRIYEHVDNYEIRNSKLNNAQNEFNNSHEIVELDEHPILGRRGQKYKFK